MEIKARNIAEEFVVISPGKTATVENADSTLYQRIDKKYNGFRAHELVAAHEFETDWNTWEVHPHGDEVVVLLSGEITFILKLPDQCQSVRLIDPGSYIIVPMGVWHTARTNTRSKLLFITPGEGTQNSEEPE